MRSVENPALRRSASRSRSCSEGVGGGVELAAVEFDDEVLGSVDGVDFVAGNGLVSLGEWEVVALEEAGEVVFEVGAGGALFGREARCAAAWISGEEVASSSGGDEPLDLGLVESPGELVGVEEDTSARSTSVRAGVVTGMP